MYVLPTFNLECSLWFPPAAPPGDPPDLASVPCQLRASGQRSSGQDSTDSGWPFLWQLLVTKETDLRDKFNAPGVYYVEVPQGSGRYYVVVIVDDVAKGFTNEYRIGYLRKVGTWPTPIP